VVDQRGVTLIGQHRDGSQIYIHVRGGVDVALVEAAEHGVDDDDGDRVQAASLRAVASPQRQGCSTLYTTELIG
jgi:hypothetical protein